MLAFIVTGKRWTPLILVKMTVPGSGNCLSVVPARKVGKCPSTRLVQLDYHGTY